MKLPLRLWCTHGHILCRAEHQQERIQMSEPTELVIFDYPEDDPDYDPEDQNYDYPDERTDPDGVR